MTTYAAQPLPVTPGAKIDIYWNWPQWLPTTDSVSTYEVTATAPLVKESEDLVDGMVMAWVSVPSDTAAGTTLQVRASIVSAEGRIDSRRYTLKVTDR